MKNVILFFLLLLLLGIIRCVDKYSLPYIYGIDDFEECKKSGGEFCEVQINMKSNKLDSDVWQYILETKLERNTLDRGILYRAVCLHGDAPVFGGLIKSRFDSELANLSLEVETVKVLNCAGPEEKLLNSYQKTLIFLLVLYMGFVGWTTLFSTNHVLRCFSLTVNHAQLAKINSNVSNQKLKSVHGIRTITCFLVLIAHTFLGYFLSYLSNIEWMENNVKGKWEFLNVLSMFGVQIFFLLMGWFMIEAMLRCREVQKTISVLDIFKIIVLRILRLWPPLLFMVLFAQSGLIGHLHSKGLQFYLEHNHETCRKMWWSTTFFLTNLYSIKDMCYFHTWYIAAEMQIFVCITIILKVIFAFRLPLIRSLLVLFGVLVTIFTLQIYKNNFDVMYRSELKDLQGYHLFTGNLLHMEIWYCSTLSNAPTVIIGLIFGTIYYRKNDVKYFDSVPREILWWIGFIGLQALAVFFGAYNYDPFTNAVVGAMLKPIFSIGFAIGILGFSEGVGGVLKTLFECKFFQYLSPITYSVYITHVLTLWIDFPSSSLMDISLYNWISSSMLIIIKSFLLGYVVTLLFELPCNNLLKTMLSKEKKTKQI